MPRHLSYLTHLMLCTSNAFTHGTYKIFVWGYRDQMKTGYGEVCQKYGVPKKRKNQKTAVLMGRFFLTHGHLAILYIAKTQKPQTDLKSRGSKKISFHSLVIGKNRPSFMLSHGFLHHFPTNFAKKYQFLWPFSARWQPSLDGIAIRHVPDHLGIVCIQNMICLRSQNNSSLVSIPNS